ncbi:hypothetical protein F511_11818 [Dorcoceras hygrometricum]|uniref:Uncharacterized protein n=1 Tax=Dorcoceras hygrometricum TaxID=472368 RepID=A0A2Z7D7H8_9LAMI|nr:hypothetical protein F511_11818 [Dorcoceras hygrometricum]
MPWLENNEERRVTGAGDARSGQNTLKTPKIRWSLEHQGEEAARGRGRRISGRYNNSLVSHTGKCSV